MVLAHFVNDLPKLLLVHFLVVVLGHLLRGVLHDEVFHIDSSWFISGRRNVSNAAKVDWGNLFATSHRRHVIFIHRSVFCLDQRCLVLLSDTLLYLWRVVIESMGLRGGLLLLVLLGCSDLLVGRARNRVNIFVEVDTVQGHVVVAEDVGLDARHKDVLFVV